MVVTQLMGVLSSGGGDRKIKIYQANTSKNMYSYGAIPWLISLTHLHVCTTKTLDIPDQMKEEVLIQEDNYQSTLVHSLYELWQ